MAVEPLARAHSPRVGTRKSDAVLRRGRLLSPSLVHPWSKTSSVSYDKASRHHPLSLPRGANVRGTRAGAVTHSFPNGPDSLSVSLTERDLGPQDFGNGK